MQRKPRPRQTALREKVVKLVTQAPGLESEEDKDSQDEDLFEKDDDFEQCLSQVKMTRPGLRFTKLHYRSLLVYFFIEKVPVKHSDSQVLTW